MTNPHPCTSRGNQLLDVIILDHNVRPKVKAQAGTVINSVALCPNLYIYDDEVRRYDLIVEFAYFFDLIPKGD